jgi:hypothetical protein
MPGLAAIAVRISALTPFLAHMAAPLGVLNYSKINYQVRAVNHSTGLGGSPPYCGPPTMDTIQVVYSVTNGTDAPLPDPAIPRLVLLPPSGEVIQPDLALGESLARKAEPPMLLHNGVLAAHETRVRADVFLAPKNAVTSVVYHLRPAPSVAQPLILPLSVRVDTPECPDKIQHTLIQP